MDLESILIGKTDKTCRQVGCGETEKEKGKGDF